MQLKKSWWLTALAVLMVGVLMAACGPAATPAPETEAPATNAPATEPPATEAPAEKKSVTFNLVQEFDTLNPYYTTMYFSTITQQVWNCWAWDFDENNSPQANLVSELPTVSEDGKTVTMHLRDDITWSDGEPITSDDFVFTYEMVIDPANTVNTTSPYDKVASVDAPDAQTVIVNFTELYAPWSLGMWHGLLPAHVLRPVYESEGNLNTAEWNSAPTVGCGPYTFVSWEPGQSATFAANPNYFDGAPLIDEIIFTFITDNDAQRAAVLAGDSDLGTFLDYSEVPDYQSGGVTVMTANSGYNEGIFFRQDDKGHPALADERVRQAIAYAIDKEAITTDLLLGLTVPAVTPWQNTPYVDPSLEPYAYDPDQANALLDEAEWVDSNGDGTRDKDGVELVLTYGTNQREIRKQVQAVIQQQLADVGIGTELLNFDSDVYFATYAEGGPMSIGDLDMFEFSNVTLWPDPDMVDFTCKEIPTDESPQGINASGLCDPELDALFEKQQQQADTNDRIETFYEISQRMYQKMYWLGLWYDPDLWAIGPRLQNVKLSGVTPFFNVAEWDVK